MATYDLVMLAVLIAAVLFGAWKGLAWQVASLAAIVASYFVALRFSPLLAERISAQEPWNRFLAMFILYVGTSLAIWIAFGFVRRSIDRMHLRDFDRHAGAAVGAVKGAIVCILITLLAVSLFGPRTKSAICQSRSGGYIAQVLNKLSGVVPQEIHQVLEPYIQRFQDVIHNPEYMEPPEPSGGHYGGWPQGSQTAQPASHSGGWTDGQPPPRAHTGELNRLPPGHRPPDQNGWATETLRRASQDAVRAGLDSLRSEVHQELQRIDPNTAVERLRGTTQRLLDEIRPPQ